MSDYTVSIPDRLYQKAMQVAEQQSLPVDEVIVRQLEEVLDQPLFDLPDDERDELRAMAYLSDDTLWTIAREQMSKTPQERMSVLMSKNSRGTIADSEYEELTELVERGNRLTLRKAQAMKYLTERGYEVTPDKLKSADE